MTHDLPCIHRTVKTISLPARIQTPSSCKNLICKIHGELNIESLKYLVFICSYSVSSLELSTLHATATDYKPSHTSPILCENSCQHACQALADAKFQHLLLVTRVLLFLLSSWVQSTLAAARADNFYYPPEWDPKKVRGCKIIN